MPAQGSPASLGLLPDETLGAIAVSVAVGDVDWSPDVAPAVMDRISRDAVAYPEQFDRRMQPGDGSLEVTAPRSAKRTLGRLVVFALIAAGIVAIVLFAATANVAAAERSPDGLRIGLRPFAVGFDGPIFATAPADGSGDLYVVEQAGRIWRVSADGTVGPEAVLDMAEAVQTSYEQGLLGLAFHPDFASNGRVFIDYTRVGDGATVVSELLVRDGIGDRGSERELLVIEQPYWNHNGGMLAFDAAGMLLIGMGDGGAGGDPHGNGQDPSSLLGKLLRIDVDSGDPYGIPPDNGFAGVDGFRPEIHAMGLRNPWRFSVDPATGDIFVGDVGQGDWEEISVLPGGRGGQSFGWNAVEGPACFTDGCDLEAHVGPALAYSHDEGCTVIGGHVARGTGQPALEGLYLFGDYCSGTIWAAPAEDVVGGTATAVQVGVMDGTLVSFGTDEAGTIYAVDQGGRILQVVTEAS